MVGPSSLFTIEDKLTERLILLSFPPRVLFASLGCFSVWFGRLVGWLGVGLVVRRPPPERKIQGSNPACAGIFSGSGHTSDLKIDTPVATLPGAWDWSARCQYTVTG